MPLIFVILFFVSTNIWANLENNQWVFHHQNKDYTFDRIGDRRGSPFVSLDELSKTFGLEITVALKDTLFRVTHNKTKRWVQVSTQSAVIQSSWGPTQLSRPAEFFKKKLGVPIDFGDRALRPLLENTKPQPLSFPKSLFEVDVVIDPGHGGNDYGAYIKENGKYVVKEKDITLELAQILSEKLNAQKIHAVLTRSEDQYLTLTERIQLANHFQAKLFISLHLNSDATKKGQGYEIYLLSLTRSDAEVRSSIAAENQSIPEDLPEGVEKTVSDMRAEANFEASLEWAKVADGAFKMQRSSWGTPIKMGPFYVLYGAHMPALLIELGFLSHPNDLSWLQNRAKQEKFMEDLANRLANAFKTSKK